MSLFSGQPTANSRRNALAVVKSKQANSPPPTTAHKEKVLSIISRTVCPASEAPLTMKQPPDNFCDYAFIRPTIETQKMLRLLPGDKDPSMVKVPCLVAELALNTHGPGEDGAMSSISCTASQADLIKWGHPEAGRIAEYLYDYHQKKIVDPTKPLPAAAPHHVASKAPAQNARVAKGTPQPRAQKSLLARLTSVFS